MISATSVPVVSFGPFRLDMPRRKLCCGPDEVRLGGRAMDILIALARHQGEVVSKDRLFAAAWPGVIVQDANLKVTVACLRRALREHAPDAGYINTIAGRGYWLDTAPGSDGDRTIAGGPIAALPEVGHLIGRDEDIASVRRALTQNRLVTIVGAGGVGKTSVAKAAAHTLSEHGSVVFVDLSRITRDDYVAASLASALGIRPGNDSLRAIVTILQRQKVLLLLDTCEHVLSAVAHICDLILAQTRNVRILATSRQLLRARGEKLCWLAPLAIPSPDHVGGIDDLRIFSATRLLIERAADCGYHPVDAEARGLAEVCRRIDGIPLAIELVSARLGGKGLAAVVKELDQCFLSLKREDAKGPARHHSLLVTLQWSYALLSQDEQVLLRALSIFAGSFDREAAVAIVAARHGAAISILDAIAGLRAKSMLCVDRTDAGFRYRLLDSTRAFAAELLDLHAETAGVSARHAGLQLERLRSAAVGERSLAPDADLASRSDLVDEVRKAVEWALFRSGNPLLGIELVAASLPLWHDLSLGEETHRNCERALAEFTRIGHDDAAVHLKLLVGLARISTYVSADGGKAADYFHRAIRLARDMGDPVAECLVLGALATYELLPGRGGAVFETLAAMREAACRANDRTALWEEAQLRAQWEIRISDFDATLARSEALFEDLREEAQRGAPRFQIHQRINVQVQLAALNWLKGRPGQAVRIARCAARDAEQSGHGLTLVHCLAQGVIWTLIQCREYDAVRPFVEKLRSAVYRHGMPAWIPVVNGYDVVVSAMSGERPDSELLRRAYADVRNGIKQLKHDARYALFAEAMLANGQIADAERVIQDVFAISSNPWGKPEFLRFRAAVERARGRQAEAEATLRQALQVAASMGCSPWQLRSALDLAMLLKDRAPAKASAIVISALKQFGGGIETGEHGAARRLLRELSRPGVTLKNPAGLH